ncbi:MAG: ATP-binding cassette domain-containing protein [Clostridiales bacterium]|nr:ATP-binding cassette domain-containing protein [Clostridiales bacterium]
MIFEKASEADISCYEDPEFYDKYQCATDILTKGYFVLFSYILSILAGSVISFVSVVSLVTAIDPVYLIFLLPVVLVFVVELFKSKVVYNRDLQMTTNDRIKAYTQRTVYLREFSKDMRTSNIFSVIISRFERAIERNIRIIKNYGFKLFTYSMVSSLFGEFIPLIGTYTYAGYQFSATNELDVSGFSVVLSSINSVSNSATDIADCLLSFPRLRCISKISGISLNMKTRLPPAIKSRVNLKAWNLKMCRSNICRLRIIRLKNLNLKISKNQTIAIVGINGAGKTTLVKLLLRFYDPSEGEILYNGVNIKEYEIHEYRRKFAAVFQDYKIFALSVNENIMCRECDDADREIAENAMKKSGVWGKINTFPEKGDTILTREFDENGTGLSGGETQKTAVARMFAREFDIAVLDEPSSALDPIVEYKMYESLLEATEDKTVVYISHRLSSAVLSDMIHVMENGTVIESGNHHDLLKSGGEYGKCSLSRRRLINLKTLLQRRRTNMNNRTKSKINAKKRKQ